MNLTAPEGVTYGSALIGLLALAIELAAWYPGRKALMKKPLAHLASLGPFSFMWAVGALVAMVTGGLVGWLTGWSSGARAGSATQPLSGESEANARLSSTPPHSR